MRNSWSRGSAYLLVVVLIVAYYLSSLSSSARVRAEEPPCKVQGSVPVNLSNSPWGSNFPTIVADSFGFVHAFWSEDVHETTTDFDSSPPAGNAIMHAQWDGVVWTSPVDVLYDSQQALGHSYAAIDATGVLHLVVRKGWGGIIYSKAPAWSCLTGKDWSEPVVLVKSSEEYDYPCLISGPDDSLHMLFSIWRDSYGTVDGNIYYMSSDDGGRTWSEPVRVSDQLKQPDNRLVYPRLAVDGRGRLHASWYESGPPNWGGEAVYYSRSDDKGGSWTSPREVYRKADGEHWATVPEVAAVAWDEIHLVWVCGESPNRCHQWSSDGGQTWTKTERLFGNLHSRAIRDSVIVDGAGTVHWVLLLRYPRELYHTAWNGHGWEQPRPFVVSESARHAHEVQLTIRNGSELHLIYSDPGMGEILHSFGLTCSPFVPAHPTPTPGARPESTRVSYQTPHGIDTVEPRQTVSAFTVVTSALQSANRRPEIADSGRTILVATTPVLVLLAVVLVFKLGKRVS